MSLCNDENLTIARLARLLKRRKLSPVELTIWALDRIDRQQSRLNSFITVTASSALDHAKAAEREICRGKYRGPLHGMPLSLKDLIYTRGVRTTAGSKILRRFVPNSDAPVVERLGRAGAILLGKTNLHEFAYGATSVDSHFGAVHNPWDTGRMSGGSSGGSAASTAAASSLASLGTDTGGSIRIPAAACGCVGFKPTYGLISTEGVIPLSATLDHVGPLTRCVEDAALLIDLLAADEPVTPGAVRDLRRGVRGLTFGVPGNYFFDHLDTEVRHSVMAAAGVFHDLGARVREVRIQCMEDTAELSRVIPQAEALVYHWKWMKERPGDYDPAIRARLEGGMGITAVDYLQARARQILYMRAFDLVMERVDLLLVPAHPVTAPLIEQKEVSIGRFKEDVRLSLLRLTRPANLTGQPAISMPCGVSRGMPIGLQLIGRRWEDSTVLRAAYAFEQATPWHANFPPDFP